MDLLIRTAPDSSTPGSAIDAIGLVREAVHHQDPNLPIIKAQRLSEAVSVALPQRLAAAPRAGLGLMWSLLFASSSIDAPAFLIVAVILLSYGRGLILVP